MAFEAKRRSGAPTVWSFDLKLVLVVSGVGGGGQMCALEVCCLSETSLS